MARALPRLDRSQPSSRGAGGRGAFTAATPAAQRAALSVAGASRGTRIYRVELSNSAGSTASADLRVVVQK